MCENLVFGLLHLCSQVLNLKNASFVFQYLSGDDCPLQPLTSSSVYYTQLGTLTWFYLLKIQSCRYFRCGAKSKI